MNGKDDTTKKPATEKEPKVKKTAAEKEPKVKKAAAAEKEPKAKKTAAEKEPRVKKAAEKMEVDKSAEALSPLKRVSLGIRDTQLSPSQLASKIAGFLDEKKAIDIITIDLTGKTIIADYFVIASARSTTAVKALTEYVDEKLSKDYEIEPLRRDMDSKWCAIDYGSVILHVFYEETRAFYQLERLWSDGESLRDVTPKN